MSMQRAHCKHCGLTMPRAAVTKLDWVCRGCGSRLRKPRWIDLIMLALSVIGFILFFILSIWFNHFLFDSILRIQSGWGVAGGVLLMLISGICLYVYMYPYFDFHRVKEARHHCVKCMYPVETDAEACPECGEIIPWNHDLPEAWTKIRFGKAICNRCETVVPRNASFEKKGEWICRGCGTGLTQVPHLSAIGNSVLAFLIVIAIFTGGVLSLVVMSRVFPAIHGLAWFLIGAAGGYVFAMFVAWLTFPLTSPYVVKDARVHCSECGVAVPESQSKCPACTRPIRYPIAVSTDDMP